MSIEEQDQILGRLIRERRESQARLAALNTKLEQAGAELCKAGETLKGFLLPQGTAAIAKARQTVPPMPSAATIMEDLRKIEAELERMRGIKSNLDSFEA